MGDSSGDLGDDNEELSDEGPSTMKMQSSDGIPLASVEQGSPFTFFINPKKDIKRKSGHMLWNNL